ncbi:sorting nexin-14-like [Zerene cesonia]|uniref:sorting nexin-14-like n=1 Tax=Zerene cesonia TaxID=33412 RepID=UPI0018E57C14|nr:sorting nexin-14-like [Zerene cesonia]
MTERCQNKSAGKNSNQNYIIYGGILVALLAVLYFYRFHLVTILVSYGLGCVACYYGLTTNILQTYIEQLTCHFIKESTEKDEAPSKGCNTCGLGGCNRHDPEFTTEPWSGLLVHKQLDQAIEDFYNTILEQFINSWYSKITLQPFFVDELRHQLRYASASLLRRALKINYAELILERLVPCALRHHAVAAGGRARPHAAACNRAAELRYLRCVADALMPYLLRPAETQNSVFKVLIREIFAGWVLLSLADTLADPYILNMLIILATGDETMAQLPTTPNYQVEFLETFVRQTESVYAQRPKLLRIELELLVNEQEHFYAFMQHLKSNSSIHVLQFYKDIKSFQSRILNPELSAEEQSAVRREARALHRRYLPGPLPDPLPDPLPGATHPLSGAAHPLPGVHLPPALQRELHDLLEGGSEADCVRRLQTSRALYQAARQSHAVLEKVLMPKFLHSEEFYKLLIGPRVPTGYHKQLTKRPQEKSIKLGTKLRNAIRPQTLDGQDTELADDGVENVDILKYLDSLASEDSLGDQDLSTCKVVLTNVETRLQAPPRRGAVRVFTIAHFIDNSPLETLRYKYEDFLQRILQISLLQTSELLYLFLTVDSDFTLVVQASTLNVNTDLGNIYQSVAHRLRKEKGQHLESFLRNFLISSDKERYQALKQGTREVEEGVEVPESGGAPAAAPPGRARRPRSALFGDNWGVPARAPPRPAAPQRHVRGAVQCLMYFLLKIAAGGGAWARALGGALALARRAADAAAARRLAARLRALLPAPRLAHLVRLGHGVLFSKKSTPRSNQVQQRELARSRLIAFASLAPRGLRFTHEIGTAFDIIQNPHLNKQLFYNLLDLCLVELFPELQGENS